MPDYRSFRQRASRGTRWLSSAIVIGVIAACGGGGGGGGGGGDSGDTSLPTALGPTDDDGPAGPVITKQPTDISTVPWSTAIFEVKATGRYPLSYQWMRDGRPIPGATDQRHVATRVGSGDAGRYWVQVSDATGRSFSTVAQLAVNPGRGLEPFVGDFAVPSGSVDGKGADAAIGMVEALAADGQGQFWFYDRTAKSLRRVNAAGVVTTVIGRSPSALTSYDWPAVLRSIAFDASGNAYLAASDLQQILRMTPDGDVELWAGGGTSAEGPRLEVALGRVRGLAFNAAGELWVAESARVRRIDPSGQVTTVVGSDNSERGYVDGLNGAARFEELVGIAIGTDGRVYVADANGSVRRIDRVEGGFQTMTLAGDPNASGDPIDGSGSSARFGQPWGIAAAANGDLIIAEQQTVRRVTPAGVVTTFAGSASEAGTADGPGDLARFSVITEIVRFGDGLLVADMANFGGQPNRLREITANGEVRTLVGAVPQRGAVDGVGLAARFNRISDITVDAAGNAYVVDAGNQLIRQVTPDGVVTTLAGQVGATMSADGHGTAATFAGPSGIGRDAAGNLYVSDEGMLRKISPDGQVTTLAGSANTGFADGAGAAARFSRLTGGVAVDPSNGVVYVADYSNRRVRRVAPDGTVTTVAGTSALQQNGNIDGPVATTGLGEVADVLVEPAGSLLSGSNYNGRLRRIDSTSVTTVAGQTASGSADGIGTAATLWSPRSLTRHPITGDVVIGSNTLETVGLVRSYSPATGAVTTIAGSASGEVGIRLGALPGLLSASNQFNSNGASVPVAVMQDGTILIGQTNGIVRLRP